MNYDELAKKHGGKVDYAGLAERVNKRYSPPPRPEPGTWFPGFQEGRHRKQLDDYKAKTDLIFEKARYDALYEETILKSEHQLSTLPERLKEHSVQAKVLHETLVIQNRAIQQLTELAVKNGMDVQTWNQLRLEQEKVAIEILKARQLSELKVEESRQMDEDRLRIAAQERDQALKALTFKALKSHAIVMGASGYVQELHVQREALVNKVVFSGSVIEPPQSEIETWH